MTGIALAATTGVLTIYAGALVAISQYIAERYTPYLTPIIWRHIAPIPLFILLSLVGIASWLVLHPGAYGDSEACLVLLADVAFGVISSYRIWCQIADSSRILGWLRKQHKNKHFLSALQELLLNGINHVDSIATHTALQLALTSPHNKKREFLGWLINHRDLLATKWLARELLDLILISGFNGPTTDAEVDVLCMLLNEALEGEVLALARETVNAVGNFLSRAPRWTDVHAHLFYRVGFTLWNIGEPGSSASRITAVPNQLAEVQAAFILYAYAIWRHIAASGDAEAVKVFCSDLTRLVSNTAPENLAEFVCEVIGQGLGQRLITAELIKELMSILDRASSAEGVKGFHQRKQTNTLRQYLEKSSNKV